MFHISVPVTPQRHWDSGEELQWELWARVFTAFPRGDYCLTCISMLWCTTDLVFFLTAASNSDPKDSPLFKSQTESVGHKLLPKNRGVLFVSLVLGYFVKLHRFLQLQEKRQWHKQWGQRVGRFPAGTSSLESSLRIV